MFDATPLYVWGRNPHYWGYQPNWQVEVRWNTAVRSAGITTLSCDERFNLCHEGPNSGGLFNGAMNSAVVIRGNVMRDGQGITIKGTTSNVLCEFNDVQNGSGGFMKDPILVLNMTDHVLQRGNIANA